jgi:hypothetical protein
MMVPSSTLVKDIWHWLRGRQITPAEKVRRRLEWKPQFEHKLWERARDRLSEDIIVGICGG